MSIGNDNYLQLDATVSRNDISYPHKSSLITAIRRTASTYFKYRRIHEEDAF